MILRLAFSPIVLFAVVIPEIIERVYCIIYTIIIRMRLFCLFSTILCSYFVGFFIFHFWLKSWNFVFKVIRYIVIANLMNFLISLLTSNFHWLIIFPFIVLSWSRTPLKLGVSWLFLKLKIFFTLEVNFSFWSCFSVFIAKNYKINIK